MIGFCGAVDLCGGEVSFSALRRMCGSRTTGCAFINGAFGLICDGGFDESQLQPVTLSYNDRLYTAAAICETPDGENGRIAQAALEGYIEEGEDFIRRFDFPYALALYDGRCGELLLTKGHLGDVPLFFCARDGKAYFSTSLFAFFRLFGGAVRVSRQALVAHIEGKMSAMPSALFPNIDYVKAGQGILCSRLGVSHYVGTQRAYVYEPKRVVTGDIPPKAPKGQMRKYLSDALYAFGYPQFDCYMPALMSYLTAKAACGSVRVEDPTLMADKAYSAERAQRLGRAAGVRTVCVRGMAGGVSKLQLKAMEKEIDATLLPYLDANGGVLRVISSAVSHANGEKDIAARIRKKGMLAQTAMWFESFDLVLV